MMNQAIFYFVDREESEASMGLHLPASLSMPDAMQIALDYSAHLQSLSDCFIETIEIAQKATNDGISPTAIKNDTELCRALFFSTATGNVIITIPAHDYNSADMTAFITELLSGNHREIINETNGEPIISFITDYDMLIPITSSTRSG